MNSNCRESYAFDVAGFAISPLLHGQTRKTKLQIPYNSLTIDPTVWNVKQPKIDQWLGIFWCGTFDLIPLSQGQTRDVNFKSTYNLLIIGVGIVTSLQESMC